MAEFEDYFGLSDAANGKQIFLDSGKAARWALRCTPGMKRQAIWGFDGHFDFAFPGDQKARAELIQSDLLCGT